MNPVWLSRDSWEKIWYALHNIQLRIGSAIEQPAANLTGMGTAARLMVDLPEPPQRNVLWRCRISELETDRWELRFFTDHPSNPKHIHYRGKDISFENDFVFEVSRSDLAAGPIYAVIIRKVNPSVGEINFTIALTRCYFQILGKAAQFAIGVCPVAGINLRNGRISVESYYDSTINWLDPYPVGMFHAEMVFSDLPNGSGGSGFQDFLSTTKQQLSVSEELTMCINNYHVKGTNHLSHIGYAPCSLLDVTTEEPNGMNWLYVFWTAEIGGYNASDSCRSPTRIRYEIRREISNPFDYDSNGNLLEIPMVKLRRISVGTNNFYSVINESVQPLPSLWINTFGKDFNPRICGFVELDLERKWLIVNSISCCHDGNPMFPESLSYSGSYENFSQFGPLYVCARYRVEDNNWSSFWLQLGNQILTGADHQTGTLYRQQIAEIRLNRDGDPFVAMQNFTRYVCFYSAPETIPALRTRSAALEDRIELLESIIRDLGNRIGRLERNL